MPRKPRLHVQDGFYHVILRGNAGQNIFFNNQDREKFYDLLKEGINRYKYTVHAFCLMSNHVHLVLQQGSSPLSKPLHNLSFRYTQWINKTQQRVGHLFHGRYKAILVEKDRYLLQLIRYIHLNPVRAKMTKFPEEYKWSSHQAYIGMKIVPWLSVEFVLAQFSQDLHIAQQKYLKFMYENLNDSYNKQFHTGGVDKRILGSDKFVKSISPSPEKIHSSKSRYCVKQVINFICTKFNINYERLICKGRNRQEAAARLALVWLCYNLGICTVTEISVLLNRDPTGYIRSLHKLNNSNIKNLELVYQDFLEYFKSKLPKISQNANVQ